jgi:hypothetical protein
MNKTICAVVASIAIAGCNWNSQTNNQPENPSQTINQSQQVQQIYQTFQIKPLGVSMQFTGRVGSIAIVGEYGGSKLLFFYQGTEVYAGEGKLAKAQALVQSEINDGDDELIEVTIQNNSTTEMTSVKANGHTVSFE